MGNHNVLAVIGSAEYMLADEIGFAKRLCEEIGVHFVLADVSIAEIIEKNPPDRCYLCKRKIFQQAIQIASMYGISNVVDGTNYDDLKENRLGLIAKKQFEIESPFADCKIGKDSVRALAKELSLTECINKTSATCLMTRFAVGAHATKQDFADIEKAEAFIKSLGFNLVRVRLRDNVMIIEVERSQLPKLTSCENMTILKDYFVKEIKKDFKISQDGYKLGFV